MKKELLISIKNAFPNEFKNKNFNYIPKTEDLYRIFPIINKYVFLNKLDISLLTIELKDLSLMPPSTKERGSYTLIDESLQHSKIIVYSMASGNNFSQIVSIFCHEMTHMYDRYFGKLKEAMYDSVLGRETFNVIHANNTQYVNKYDVHGRYFQKFISKFNDFGITVKTAYAPTDRKLLKMIDENDIVVDDDNDVDMSFFRDVNLVESDTVDDPEFKARLERFVDSLTGTSYKKLGYVDKNHYYITIS